MFIKTVAVLFDTVPVLLYPTALTVGPFAGFTLTVTGVFKGRPEQRTTMGRGAVC